jgi:hypothetical protein
MKFTHEHKEEARRVVRNYFKQMDESVFNIAFDKYVKGVPSHPLIPEEKDREARAAEVAQERHSAQRTRADRARAADLEHRLGSDAAQRRAFSLAAAEGGARWIGRRAPSAGLAPEGIWARGEEALAVLGGEVPPSGGAPDPALLEEPGGEGEGEIEADDEGRAGTGEVDEVVDEFAAVATALEADECAVANLRDPDRAPRASNGAGPVDGQDILELHHPW